MRLRVANPSDVDDLLQEILIKTYQHLPQLSNADRIQPWLYKVAQNALIDFYRRNNKNSALTTFDEATWQTTTEDTAENTSLQELSHCLEPFINALPEDSAALLRAVELYGQTQKSLAAEQGIPYSTLKSQVQKGRTELKQLFDECCTMSLDTLGNIIAYEPNSDRCNDCD